MQSTFLGWTWEIWKGHLQAGFPIAMSLAALWISIASFRRTSKRVKPIVQVEVKGQNLTAFFRNEGNHPYTIKRVRALDCDGKEIHELFNAANSDPLPPVKPGDMPKLSMGTQKTFLVASVELETDSGDTFTVPVNQNAKFHKEWFDFLAVALAASLEPDTQSAIGFEVPFTIQARNNSGDSISFEIQPFNPITGGDQFLQQFRSPNEYVPLYTFAHTLTELVPSLFELRPGQDSRQLLYWKPEFCAEISGPDSDKALARVKAEYDQNYKTLVLERNNSKELSATSQLSPEPHQEPVEPLQLPQ